MPGQFAGRVTWVLASPLALVVVLVGAKVAEHPDGPLCCEKLIGAPDPTGLPLASSKWPVNVKGVPADVELTLVEAVELPAMTPCTPAPRLAARPAPSGRSPP